MRIAALDIGTNTILMLVADVDNSGRLSVIRDEHSIGRLGKGVDADRLISDETIERVEGILRSQLELARTLGCERIVAGATSAMRDAANRELVLRTFRDHLGLDVRVLSANEEAALTFRGTLSGIDRSPKSRAGVIDIGGGSTEIMVGTGEDAQFRTSVDIGAVRLTERWWDGYPMSEGRWKEVGSEIQKELQNIQIASGPIRWFGVAGTPTTLAAIALTLNTFDPAAIDGYALTRDFVEQTVHELSKQTLAQLRAHPQIHPGRADIIVAGALILREIMRRFRIREIGVSVRGLRYGLAVEGATTILGE